MQGEHLRTIPAQYESHYNGQHPHRGRQFRPHRPDHPVADLSKERIQRRPVLGGLINEYEPAAEEPRSGPVAEFWNPTGRHPASSTGRPDAVRHRRAQPVRQRPGRQQPQRTNPRDRRMKEAH
jgi:hypothetical protein